MTKFNKKLLCLGTCLSLTTWGTQDPTTLYQKIKLGEVQKEALQSILPEETCKKLMGSIDEYNKTIIRLKEQYQEQCRLKEWSDKCANEMESAYDAYKKCPDDQSQKDRLLSQYKSQQVICDHYKNLYLQSIHMTTDLFKRVGNISNETISHLPFQEKQDALERILLEEVLAQTVNVSNQDKFQTLRRALCLPEDTEIYLIDHERFIHSLGLTLDREKHYISLLAMTDDGQQSFISAFKAFINTYLFQDAHHQKSEDLKHLIVRMISDVAWCPAARELVVMWMAQREATLSASGLSSILHCEEDFSSLGSLFSKDYFVFSQSDCSSNGTNNISLSVGKDFVHTTVGGAEILVSLVAQLLHEIGHQLDTQWSYLKRLNRRKEKFISGTEDILQANLQEVEINTEKFNELPFTKRAAMDQLQLNCRLDDDSRWSKAKSFVRNLFHSAEDPLVRKVSQGEALSAAEKGKFIWHNPEEFKRIAGLRLYEKDGKHILVVDPYSDWAIASVLNFPKVSSHLGYSINNGRRKYFEWIQINPKQVSENKTTYDILNEIYMNIHGVDLKQSQENYQRIQEIVKLHTWPYKGSDEENG